jgi:PhzF family phenazine biosynthesis protein
MKIKIYQIDAFAEQVFSGNPAAVCPLDEWLSDDILQNIAMENNLAETAFYVREGQGFHIRWFTPGVEVDLCGHATLAAAYVLFNHENYQGDKISFNSRSGLLTVSKNDDILTLDFPADTIQEIELSPELIAGFDQKPLRAFRGKTDYMFVFENEAQIKNIQTDLKLISQLDARGVIITAKGDEVDFVSRFFAPQSGIDEDPVTGSAHTSLTPYWSEELGKKELSAIQLSSRKGYLKCVHLNGRVEISGRAQTFLIGDIYLK